jgi:Ca2+-transporting ATPase
MATGDHRKTAEHIGKELGLVNVQFPNIIEGTDFVNKTEKEQKQILTQTNVFARVTPEAKLQIAKLLQKQKEVVTMIGDGVNDTLALKQADVGVAMGNSGTDAARSASSIVLTDDNFNTIILAIFRGRHIYANIRNVTNFLLSTNAAEALVLILVTFFGLPLPLAATQILLINLVTDGLGSLPFAFRKPGTSKLPRPQAGKLLTRHDYGLIGSATLGMTVATLVGFMIFLDNGVVYAQTMAFTILALTQIGRLISLDSSPDGNVIKKFFQDSWLFRSVGVSLLVITLVLAVPQLREVFNFDILQGIDIVVAFGLSLAPFVTVEIYKAIARMIPKKYYA